MQICWHMIHCISVSFCKENDTKLDLNTLKWQPFSSSFFACHLIFPLIFFCFASFRNISFTARLQHNNIKRNDILHSPIHFILFFLSMFFLFVFFASSTQVISIFFHFYFAMCCFFLFLFRLKLLFFFYVCM